MICKYLVSCDVSGFKYNYLVTLLTYATNSIQPLLHFFFFIFDFAQGNSEVMEYDGKEIFFKVKNKPIFKTSLQQLCKLFHFHFLSAYSKEVTVFLDS